MQELKELPDSDVMCFSTQGVWTTEVGGPTTDWLKNSYQKTVRSFIYQSNKESP